MPSNFILYFNIFRSKIRTAVILLILLMLVGVFGFKLMPNYTWTDAIYMTVITIATVGFGEVHPLNDTAKIFTVFLILSSVFILGYALKIITEYVINKNNFREIKVKQMEKSIQKMKNHIVICGYGRNGKQAAKKLGAYQKEFIVIDKDRDLLERLKDDNIIYLEGNAILDETLKAAGIERASTLICALPNDADNLFIVLSARQINPKLKIISRASVETSYNKLKLAGADNVILPDKIGGDHMASLVVVPDLLEFIDNLAIVGKSNINIEEIPLEKLYNIKYFTTLEEIDLRKNTGCTVIGYKNSKGDYHVNPDTDMLLEPNSKIIVLGKPEQINRLNQLCQIV